MEYTEEENNKDVKDVDSINNVSASIETFKEQGFCVISENNDKQNSNTIDILIQLTEKPEVKELLGFDTILYKDCPLTPDFDEKIWRPNLILLIEKLQHFTDDALINHINNQRLLRKTAIISILIDSFSHNISAHSLNAVIWLYLKRQERLDYRFLVEKNELTRNVLDHKCDSARDTSRCTCVLLSNKEIKDIAESASKDYETLGANDSTYNTDYFSIHDIINYMNKTTRDRLFYFHELPYDINHPENKMKPIIPVPLDCEMANFLTYINEKSAFWNGVTRDIPSGGMITDWYSILYQFANNPLFLGTIAHSEGIYKIKVKVGYNKITPMDFVNIDISQLFSDLENHENNQFITYGDKFSTLRKELANLGKVFIPGGVIGKHALFTIFENTLRNIKHCKISGHSQEIIFCINIYSVNDKLFKLTCWLDNKSEFTKDDKKEMDKKLENTIITEDGSPILGGTSQDKICAAMLFNNRFSSIEISNYFIIKNDNVIKAPWIEIKALSGKKIIKRSLHLWKGSLSTELDINQLSGSEKEIKENTSRFKFVYYNIISEKDDHIISENGLIRLIPKDEKPAEESIDNWYCVWDKKWLKYKKPVYFARAAGNNPEYNHKIAVTDKGYYKYFYLENSDVKAQEYLNENNLMSIRFAHGEVSGVSKNILQYRNHGPLVENYVEDNNNVLIDPLCFKKGHSEGEFIETLLTKIEIYDNRIYDRVNNRGKTELFKDSLSLDIKDEKCMQNGKKTDFKFPKYNNKSDQNIIIIHLSLIESFKGYSETNINEFVKIYFGDYLNENSKLVITTGRGRGLWWDCLKKHSDTIPLEHILFKPIDSLLAAVQEGLIYHDDFMVKHNLMKVIFGS